MKGSSWLTPLPLKTENYILNKREFFDAVAIKYRWLLKRLPILCACGNFFTTDHAMSCLKGGFIHQRHDIIRDTLSKIFEEVCTDVSIEPPLLPITGEDQAINVNTADEAPLDIAARGFWQRGRRHSLMYGFLIPSLPPTQTKNFKMYFKLTNEKRSTLTTSE